MNAKTILMGLALLIPASTYSVDAMAYAKCDKMDDDKKKAKCEKKEGKRISKLRAKTTPFVPSSLTDKFSSLDAEDANPFNTDNYYTPSYEPLGVEAADMVFGGVSRIEAALTMATYVGALSKEGKTDEAKALATDLLPELVKLKDEIQNIKTGVEKIKADPAALAKDNPMLVPKIVGGAGAALAKLPGIISDLPKALSAVKPLAAGAAGAAAGAAMDKVGDAAGAAKDAIPAVPEVPAAPVPAPAE
jgi:hypothetical protein